MKKQHWLLIVLGILVVIQFIRPNFNNQPVDPAVDFKTIANPPAEVRQLLEAACYDCHSNNTKLPWYTNLAPVSWWIANHVKEGREHVNFSEFGKYSAEDRPEIMEEAAEEIGKKKMPLDSYTWMHPEAKLTDAQRKLLSDWFNAGSGEAEGGAGQQGEGQEGDED